MANRTIRLDVYQRGKQDQLSRNSASITVTNPQPLLPFPIDIEPVFDTIFFKYTPPADLDWAGILIWLDTDIGFDPLTTDPVYKGSGTIIPFGGLLPATTYYIRFAAFDTFSLDDIIISDPVIEITTIEIITNQIADFAVTNAKIENLSAEKIVAGHITADDIFLGASDRFLLDGANTRLTIKDDQGASGITRVKLGQLEDSPAPEDYGLEIFDQNGNLVIGADGLGLSVIGEDQLQESVVDGLTPDGDVDNIVTFTGMGSGKKTKDSGVSILELKIPGQIVMYGSSTAPGGWLNCDGTSYAEVAYPDLFDVIGTDFGGGGGNFNVPDYQRRSPMGNEFGSGDRDIGDEFGEEDHVLSVSEMPAHVHNVSTSQGLNGVIGPRDHPIGNQAGIYPTTSSGGSAPHNTVHPCLVSNFIIKT